MVSSYHWEQKVHLDAAGIELRSLTPQAVALPTMPWPLGQEHHPMPVVCDSYFIIGTLQYEWCSSHSLIIQATAGGVQLSLL